MPLLEDFGASAASDLSLALRTTVQVQQPDTTEATVPNLIVADTYSFPKLDIGRYVWTYDLSNKLKLQLIRDCWTLDKNYDFRADSEGNRVFSF